MGEVAHFKKAQPPRRAHTTQLRDTASKLPLGSQNKPAEKMATRTLNKKDDEWKKFVIPKWNFKSPAARAQRKDSPGAMGYQTGFNSQAEEMEAAFALQGFGSANNPQASCRLVASSPQQTIPNKMNIKFLLQ